jgi:hypothetical protein
MRLIFAVVLLAVPWSARAWDTGPHQRITKAALEALPKPFLQRLGTEIAPLIEIYCMYPDRYLEMERFGFVRKSAGPRSVSEVRQYCLRPDGQTIHGATGDATGDRASLIYLFERVVTSLSENRPAEAAKYAGVLSHFVADSLSPPHAADENELNELLPGPVAGLNLHGAIERSLPSFNLEVHTNRRFGTHLLSAADAVLQECYAGARQNRKDLPVIVRAVYSRDEQVLDAYRLRAGRQAAAILADALGALFRMAEPAP